MYVTAPDKSTAPGAGKDGSAMWLFFIFVAVPIVEIALFISVGGAIGLWTTLAVVVLTAMIGTALMRQQGRRALRELQAAIAHGDNPTDPVAQGALILVAGLLLLTPGFFTDSVGFLLLIPAVRMVVIRAIRARLIAHTSFTVTGFGTPARDGGAAESVLEGEYTVVDDAPRDPPGKPSGWSNH